MPNTVPTVPGGPPVTHPAYDAFLAGLRLRLMNYAADVKGQATVLDRPGSCDTMIKMLEDMKRLTDIYDRADYMQRAMMENLEALRQDAAEVK